jgi:hypothetical protein
MTLITWFIVLVLQAMGFTVVSRARNSGSVIYHGIVSVISNSVWFVSQLFLVSFMTKPDMPLGTLVIYGAVYVSGNTIGSTLMHYISIRWLEKGKRKVGG